MRRHCADWPSVCLSSYRRQRRASESSLAAALGFLGFHVDGPVLEMAGGWTNEAYKTSVKAPVNCGRIWSSVIFGSLGVECI